MGVGWPEFAVIVPFIGAVLLGVLRTAQSAGWINLAVAALTCVLTSCLPLMRDDGTWLLLDQGGIVAAMLTGITGVVAAWPGSRGSPQQVSDGLAFACAQAVQGCVLLAALADSPSVAWAALGAALAGSMFGADAPSFRFVPGGGGTKGNAAVLASGLGLALLGTAWLALAGQPTLGSGTEPGWSGLLDGAAGCRGAVLTLAFAALLAGYGTLVVSAPAPASAAGVPGVALILLLRAAAILSANAAAQGGAIDPGPTLIVFGASAALIGLVMLWQAPTIPALIAGATVNGGGIVGIAFGLGSVAATQAGLLQLAAGTLARIAVLHCTAPDGTPHGHRGRLALVLSLAALAGLPPTGLFTAAMLLLSDVMQGNPLLACGIGGGLALGAAPCLARAGQVARSQPMATGHVAMAGWGLAGTWLCLALLVILGLLPILLGGE